MALMQRKYIDLLHETAGRWVNWEPTSEIRIGSYGTVNKDTGELMVEGNVYDPEFQKELDRQDIRFNLANYPPQEGVIEDDFVVSSRRCKSKDLEEDDKSDIHEIADASIKWQWEFEEERRAAVLVMRHPRQIAIPPDVVLEHLYQVDKLIDKFLITGTYVCPAYCMYLSDKSGDKLTLALLPKEEDSGSKGKFAWWDNAKTGLLRHDVDADDEYTLTPLYSMRRPIKRKRRFFRDAIRPEPTGDKLWYNDSPPWDPLDDDGEEDFIDPLIKAVDPFKHLEEATE